MNRAPGQLSSTDWRPPTELPDLRRVGIIALDTETKDDGLLAERGSGWATRQGHICGISIAYRIEIPGQELTVFEQNRAAAPRDVGETVTLSWSPGHSIPVAA